MPRDLMFSGMVGEDVDLYLNRCRVQWMGMTLSEEDRSLAIATTTLAGLRGAANRFVKKLPKDNRDDAVTLHAKLREEFQERDDPERNLASLQDISNLSQKGKTMHEYTENVRDLELKLPTGKEWQGLLARGAVDGIQDPVTRMILVGHLEANRHAENPLTLDNILNMATELEDGKECR